MTGARSAFVDAVLDLSDDPGPATVARYLEASRALEQSQTARRTPSKARPRPGATPAALRRGKPTGDPAPAA